MRRSCLNFFDLFRLANALPPQWPFCELDTLVANHSETLAVSPCDAWIASTFDLMCSTCHDAGRPKARNWHLPTVHLSRSTASSSETI